MAESQNSLKIQKQIDQTTVFRSLGTKYNETIYYFPTYLRIKLKYISSMEPETRYATADISMYLSIYYGSAEKYIIDGLAKKVFIEPEFNDIIQLNLNQQEDKTQKRQPVYLVQDQNNHLLHWKIDIKEFIFKIKPHIFFHPFQTLDLLSQIKISPVQFTLNSDRTIIAVFNLMNNEKPSKKLIEGSKNYQVGGFYISSNRLQMTVLNSEDQMKQFKEKIQQQLDEMYNETENIKTLRFIQEPQQEIRHVMDYFSTAKVKLHLHSNGKAAFSNFTSNFLCFVMLAILSVFVHFQELKAAEIIASLATIAIAFGTSIISIRSQIVFKPGQTFFEIVYCTQMVILLIPLFDYWQSVKPATSTITTTATASQQSVNSTSSISVSATSDNSTIIAYLDAIYQQVKDKPLVDDIWTNSFFEASIVITFFLCLLIVLLCLYNVYIFCSFRKKNRLDKTKAQQEFMRFDRTDWKNQQCRDFFADPRFSFLVELQRPKSPSKKMGIVKRDY